MKGLAVQTVRTFEVDVKHKCRKASWCCNIFELRMSYFSYCKFRVRALALTVHLLKVEVCILPPPFYKNIAGAMASLPMTATLIHLHASSHAHCLGKSGMPVCPPGLLVPRDTWARLENPGSFNLFADYICSIWHCTCCFEFWKESDFWRMQSCVRQHVRLPRVFREWKPKCFPVKLKQTGRKKTESCLSHLAKVVGVPRERRDSLNQ